MKISKKRLIILASILIIVGGVGLFLANRKDISANAVMDMNSKTSVQSQPVYKVDMMSGTSYQANTPSTLHFAVQDKSGTVFKNFELDSTKLMHLIVARKDRSNFQHVHPTYDSDTGMFMLTGFEFPTDGVYRVYANFAPTNAKKDVMGMTETEAPFVDVNVGDNPAKVASEPLGVDSLTSSVNGLTASIIKPPNDDSPGSDTITQPTFYAGQDGTVLVSITQNGEAFKNLQSYLGNLGHMVVLGPNLEFIHAHPLTNDLNNQSGLITFMVNFPTPGQYRLYLQAQANETVSTFSFNVAAQKMPMAANSNSMPGMSH